MMSRLAIGAIAALVLTSCGKREEQSATAPFAEEVVATVGDEVITATEFRAALAHRGGDPRGLLDEMIEKRKLVVRARQAGLDDDPEVQRLLRNALIGKLRERELAEAEEVSEQDVRAYYETHPHEFAEPERLRVAMIRARDRAKVESASEEAESEEFRTLAVRYSEDQANPLPRRGTRRGDPRATWTAGWCFA